MNSRERRIVSYEVISKLTVFASVALMSIGIVGGLVHNSPIKHRLFIGVGIFMIVSAMMIKYLSYRSQLLDILQEDIKEIIRKYNINNACLDYDRKIFMNSYDLQLFLGDLEKINDLYSLECRLQRAYGKGLGKYKMVLYKHDVGVINEKVIKINEFGMVEYRVSE